MNPILILPGEGESIWPTCNFLLFEKQIKPTGGGGGQICITKAYYVVCVVIMLENQKKLQKCLAFFPYIR